MKNHRGAGFIETIFRFVAGQPKYKKAALSAAVGCLALFAPSLAQAGLITTVNVGPETAPNRYNLSIEFGNGNFYNFTLRSTATSLTGYDFINTVSTLTQGTSTVLTVQQVGSAFGYYINGMTVNSDANSGFVNNSYWAYWNSPTSNPSTQWTFADVGESDRTLTPGMADAWVYSDGSRPPQATSFPAVPEPGTWLVLMTGVVGLGVVRVTRRTVAA